MAAVYVRALVGEQSGAQANEGLWPGGTALVQVVVCTTPVEGHASIMRVTTFCDSHSALVRAVGWVVAGVAISQLAADIRWANGVMSGSWQSCHWHWYGVCPLGWEGALGSWCFCVRK